MENGATPDKLAYDAVVLQGFLQYLCQGVIFSQAVKFWKRSSEDTVYLRSFVGVQVVLACFQTGISSYKLWVVAINDKHWWSSRLYNTDFLVNGLICSFCEVYLVRRCYKVSQHSKIVLVSLSTLLLVALAANIYLAVRVGQTIGIAPPSQDPLRASLWVFPVWVWCTLALEVGITTTWYSALDKTIHNIIGITWESAALPCICMIIAAILYRLAKKNVGVRHWDLFFILSVAKFYQLGLLRTLNSRIKFRHKLANAKLGRQSLGTWLSGETTVCDREEAARTSPGIQYVEVESRSILPSPRPPSPLRIPSGLLINAPPSMYDAREREDNVTRKVGFAAV